MTPICCGGKIFSLKLGKLSALTETVGISQVLGESETVRFTEDLWTCQIMEILYPTPDKRELVNDHAAIYEAPIFLDISHFLSLHAIASNHATYNSYSGG